jgi:hypothetical protein
LQMVLKVENNTELGSSEANVHGTFRIELLEIKLVASEKKLLPRSGNDRLLY